MNASRFDSGKKKGAELDEEPMRKRWEKDVNALPLTNYGHEIQPEYIKVERCPNGAREDLNG